MDISAGDWLDLTDSRQGGIRTTMIVTQTLDINDAFDAIANLFEQYPQPPAEGKGKRRHKRK